MKSTLKLIAALVALSPLACVQAQTYSEDQVLHAVFVAFQPVDIYSSNEIKASRELLFVAAAEGNDEAKTVLGGLSSFVQFYESAPRQSQVSIIERILGKNLVTDS